MNAVSVRIAFPLAFALAAVPVAAAQDSAQVVKGKEHYTETCQLCHGVDGKRGEGFQTPIWGEGSFIASKFGNAGALLEYMQLMPFNDPTLLDDTQKIAVVAYMLANHGAIPRTGEITRQSAPAIPIK
jgi:mono/diheme cytochrome c family protein